MLVSIHKLVMKSTPREGAQNRCILLALQLLQHYCSWCVFQKSEQFSIAFLTKKVKPCLKLQVSCTSGKVINIKIAHKTPKFVKCEIKSLQAQKFCKKFFHFHECPFRHLKMCGMNTGWFILSYPPILYYACLHSQTTSQIFCML